MTKPDPETIPGTKQWHWTPILRDEFREPVHPYYMAIVTASGWPVPIDIGRPDLVGQIDYALDHLDTLDRRRGQKLQIVDAERWIVVRAWRLPTIDKWWFSSWLLQNVIPYLNRDPLTIDILLRMNEGEFNDIHRKDILWWQNTYKRNPDSV